MSVAETVEFMTSGSTGGAKKIVKTCRSLDLDAEMLVKSLPELFASRPYVVATIRREHMFGALWRARVPAIAGCEVHPETVISVEQLVAAAEGHEKLLLLTTPSFLEGALKNVDFKELKPQFSGIVTSGSLLGSDLARRVFEAAGVAVTEIFGSTETGSVAWRRQIDGELWTLFDAVAADVTGAGFIQVDSEFSFERPFTMGDLVEFVSPREFRLLGRGDRRVKILERYVSLPLLEEAMEKHPFVARAHAVVSDDAVPRIHALVELSDEGKARLKCSTYSRMTALLKREIGGIEPFAFPRRIRYLNAFPYNEQGKLPRASVMPILSSRYQEPVIEDVLESEETYSAEVTFIPDAVYFEGHFNAFKILPGVVQLDLAERLIRRKWRMPPFAGEILRLKFQRPVQPRERVHLELKRSSPDDFAFAIDCGGSPCTSGVMKYRVKKTPRVLSLAAALICSAAAMFVSAAERPVPFENAMRRALTSSASWTMTKTWSDSPIRISSSGTVSCVKGGGIFWRVDKPIASSVSMTAGEMVFRDMRGVRRIKDSDVPHYGEIKKAIDCFAAGGPMTLENLFNVRFAGDSRRWSAELLPKRRDMGYLIKSIRLSGAEKLDEAVLKFASGETSSIRFSETPGVR